MTPTSNNELLAGKLELMTAERDKLLLELGDLRALRAARPSTSPDAKTVLSCRNCAGFGWEPTVYSGRIPCSHCSTAPSVVNQSEAVVNEKAQQMAILQEKDKLFEGLSTGQVMQKAFAWCPTDHPHQWRMQWIADYFIANAPQADALAADHVEDMRAMVPMTDQELDDLLPTNDSMSRKDSQRWIARATERHHKIGVKQ